MGMHAGGMALGVVEVDEPAVDAELLAQLAPLIAIRASLLAGQGVGQVLFAPVAVEGASDVVPLMSAFATEAKRQLSHDRLSAYLLTCRGRAFERFAVATSPIVPGEGVVIPFEDLGLRHVVITNRALISPDLATDERVVGREDRVISAAGFHGLLSVPLRIGGRPIGVLNFVSRSPGFYREEDIPIGQQIADQVAAFIDNLHAQQQMRALIRHETAERERARVGRDVYHAVAQSVPSITRAIDSLEARLDSADPEARQRLARLRQLTQGTLGDVRRAIADLLPREIDAMTLEEAARAAVSVLGDADPKAHVDARDDTSRVPPAVRRAACRIMQEAVTNVRLHAQARSVRITIECGRDLMLTVADDGRGFDPDQLHESVGMGIEHMHERANALGGRLTVTSTPGHGTCVRFELLGVGYAEDALPSSSRETEPAADRWAGSLRVFVIDRHPLLRAGLLHLAESVPDLRVVGDAAGTKEALAQLRRLRPDVVLLDGHLPVGELERLIAELQRDLPLTRVVVTFESDTGHEAALAEAGACRFLHKTATVAELADAVRAAASSTVAEVQERATGARRGTLSPRERSILLLMSGGRTNTEIGQTLFLATKTVERQVATIVRKLGARNRAHAAAIAVSRHIVDPEQAG